MIFSLALLVFSVGAYFIYQGRTCETHLLGGCVLAGSALIALAISELKDGIIKQMKGSAADTIQDKDKK